MKERPILFSSEMVRAILDNRKTQTRRVIKPQPPADLKWGGWLIGTTGNKREIGSATWDDEIDGVSHRKHSAKCPYGDPGDHLWVRETWADLRAYMNETYPHQPPAVYKADYIHLVGEGWKPSIFMPRWASRITLEITWVRVERVQDISEADAIAEGVAKNWIGNDCPPEYTNEYERYGAPLEVPPCYSAKESYETLWDSINEKRGYSWASNPWVWVVEFTRLT